MYLGAKVWPPNMYGARIVSEHSVGIGGGIMRRTQRGVDVARARQAWRPVTLILAVTGAVILTGAGCGQSTSATNIAAQGGGSGCPTQGVGGDTQAPLCVQPAGVSSSATNGITNPPAVSGGTPPPAASPNVGITGPVSPLISVSPTISGPISVPATPTGPNQAAPAAVPPQVTAISPASGTEGGGDSVTITGSGFTDATAVDFGGVSATMTVNSDTEITATSPRGTGTGTVDITVVTPSGESATGPADQFTYVS